MLVYLKIAGKDMAAHAGVGDFHGWSGLVNYVTLGQRLPYWNKSRRSAGARIT